MSQLVALFPKLYFRPNTYEKAELKGNGAFEKEFWENVKKLYQI